LELKYYIKFPSAGKFKTYLAVDQSHCSIFITRS